MCLPSFIFIFYLFWFSTRLNLFLFRFNIIFLPCCRLQISRCSSSVACCSRYCVSQQLFCCSDADLLLSSLSCPLNFSSTSSYTWLLLAHYLSLCLVISGWARLCRSRREPCALFAWSLPGLFLLEPRWSWSIDVMSPSSLFMNIRIETHMKSNFRIILDLPSSHCQTRCTAPLKCIPVVPSRMLRLSAGKQLRIKPWFFIASLLRLHRKIKWNVLWHLRALASTTPSHRTENAQPPLLLACGSPTAWTPLA